LPVAVLYEDRLVHNLEWMRQFVSAYHVELCPHGKTTMAPKLFQRQLSAGAWGITLATAPQVKAAYDHGVRRVIMANQLVGRQNMAIISELLKEPDFEFYCLVDSEASVKALASFFGPRGQTVNVLLELGIEGGRSGVRTPQQDFEVLAALNRCREAVKLCGIELFEGLLHEEVAVRALLARAVDLAEELIQKRWLHEGFILSGAGSEWFDVVAEVFTSAKFAVPAKVVLRPGCYLTHDVGLYKEPAERMRKSSAVVRDLGEGLKTALQVWAYVQSRPEPDMVVIGVGKRDASYDAGFPMPVWHYRPGSSVPIAANEHWEITRMMDQHAMMRIKEGDDVKVGDMIGFDISHPCLTFDKWRYLPILDAGFNVVDVVETFF